MKTNMVIPKLDLTKKIIVWVGILSLLTLIIIFGIFVPALNYIKNTADESYKLRVFLEQKYEQSLRSRITRKKLGEIKDSLSKFDPFLFKSGEELKLITFLENLSAKHNISQTISNSTLDKVTSGRIASVSMGLSGNYNDILKYIADLETADYFIYVNQMQFTAASTKTGETTQNTNLNLTIELYVN
jgi:Tfp pilus assembly protein PilO